MKFVQNQKMYAVLLASLSLSLSLSIVQASSLFERDSDIGLLSYMARANDLLQQDPTRSLECFNKYIPLINAIASDYETNFQACLNESDAASAKADEATLDERNDLANAAAASCAVLNQCQEDKSVEEIFQCYLDGGSANIRTMYIINANASQDLAALREQYYLIKNEQFKCTNETKRTYERKSAEAYAGLNNCILGNPESAVTEEPPSPTTQSPIVTQAPSEIPEQTTPGQPEPSDNPITSSAPTEAAEGTTNPTNAQEESTENPITLAPEEQSPEESL